MKIAFISFYDDYVVGPRTIAACLKGLGHECRFIHLKAMFIHMFRRDSRDAIRPLRDVNPLIAVSSYEEGDVCTPTPLPITPREEGLFLEELQRDLPDIAGFCVQWTAYPYLERFSRLIRDHFPSIRIAVGGPPVITSPEMFFPYADVFCLGEGESAVVEWLEDPDRTDVTGLWFRQGGDVIRNPLRPLLHDLDSLPIPSYGENECLIHDDSVSRILDTNPLYLRDKWLFNSTRGCLMHCSYCIEGHMARAYPGQTRRRRRSVEHFLAEFREARRRLPFESIEIHDNIFVMDEPWLEEFAEKYPRDIGIPFRCNACPGVSTRRMLQLAREAGAEEVSVDLQSASEATLRRYDRPTRPERVRQTVVDALDVGFERVSCDLIVHSPYDSETALRETFEFLVNLPAPVYLFVGHLVSYPGVRLGRDEPPADPLDYDTHRFWTVLDLLTQFKDINRRGLRRIANDPRIRNRPAALDELLGCYVKRHKYLGKPIWLRHRTPQPTADEVGSFPALRLFLQTRFPWLYARGKLLRHAIRSRWFAPRSALPIGKRDRTVTKAE